MIIKFLLKTGFSNMLLYNFYSAFHDSFSIWTNIHLKIPKRTLIKVPQDNFQRFLISD